MGRIVLMNIIWGGCVLSISLKRDEGREETKTKI
jgi:hypothetical protein